MEPIHCVSYNIGQLFDYQALVLRNGVNSTDACIKEIFASIFPLYQVADDEFNQMSEEQRKANMWKNPRFNVAYDIKTILEPIRCEKLKKILNVIASRCDLIFLQEVVDDEKTIKEVFTEDKFEFFYHLTQDYRKKMVPDSLLVWRKDKFNKEDVPGVAEILNQSEERNRSKSAVVRLQHIGTKYFCDVASLHAPGYQITNPTEQNVANGNNSVKLVVDILKKYGSNSFALVAGDFNSELKSAYLTEEKRQFSERRFSLLEEEGFVCIDHSFKTAFNTDFEREGHGLCTLDYIYSKNTLENGKVNVLISDDEDLNYSIEEPSSNPSDHKPLFFEVNFLQT